MYRLAICIPCYNRPALLNEFLNSIPSNPNIIISICDDGSTDDIFKIIKNHNSRLKISYIRQLNEGRASALRKSIIRANAEYIIIMDSDDIFTKNGVENVLNAIHKYPKEKFLVFSTIIIRGLETEYVSLKNIPKTNYIKIKADFKIKSDLKEVTSKELIMKVMYPSPKKIRRIPTGYLWTKISALTDCLPIDTDAIAVKKYLNDGMTVNKLPLLVKYPEYLVKYYKILLKSKKYSSKIYKFKCYIQYYRYSFHNKTNLLPKFIYLPFFVAG